jgi:hypothetical protein
VATAAAGTIRRLVRGSVLETRTGVLLMAVGHSFYPPIDISLYSIFLMFLYLFETYVLLVWKHTEAYGSLTTVAEACMLVCCGGCVC